MSNKNVCKFDNGGKSCSALKTKKCDGCKFRKTEAEFMAGVEKANAILESKNLVPIERLDRDGVHISVKRII